MLIIRKPKKEITIDLNDKTQLVDIILALYKLRQVKNEMLLCAFIKESAVIEIDLVCEGNKNAVDVPIMDIIQRAMALEATHIAVFHTHPNNSLIFSKEDYVGHELLDLYTKEFGLILHEDGVIDFSKNSFLSVDNNIYMCTPKKYEFKTILNKSILNMNTLYCNRQGINSLREQLSWR